MHADQNLFGRESATADRLNANECELKREAKKNRRNLGGKRRDRKLVPKKVRCGSVIGYALFGPNIHSFCQYSSASS
jgi:hypothetical protein